jgi:cytochrome c-type biogenesis protein CcmH/NrfF
MKFLPLLLMKLLLVNLVFTASFALAGDRENKLYHRIKCPVCYGQSIAESDTEISKILRQEVKVMIDSGVSDEEILELLRNSYGNDIVSLEHELKPLNWFIMLVASAMLLMFAYLFFKSTESSQNIMHKKRRK